MMKLLVASLLLLCSSAQADLAQWGKAFRTNAKVLQADHLLEDAAVAAIDPNGSRIYLTGRAARETVFEIGSISKSFTGILLAELVDEGKVALDDPVEKHFRALAGTFIGRATLGQLATHTSGLPRMPCDDPAIAYCFVPKNPENPYVGYSLQQLLDYLRAYTRPGTGPYPNDYSNTGFALLGLVLEAVESKTFEQLLSERITGPLRMGRTRVKLGLFDELRLIRGHDISERAVEHWDLGCFAPAGGIHSTIEDLEHFLSANIGADASTALGRAMFFSQTHALGWDSPEGAAGIWKNGGTGGFHSLIVFNRATHRGLVGLANTDDSTIEDLISSMFGYPLPNYAGTPPELPLVTYAGTYVASDGSRLELSIPRGVLIMRTHDDLDYLSPASETKFLTYDGASLLGADHVEFTLVGGQVTALSFDGKTYRRAQP
jgi:CubicO group peptidase (beta-lactamase class C family)